MKGLPKLLVAALCSSSVFGRLTGQQAPRQDDLVYAPHERHVMEESATTTTTTPCITGFQVVNAAVGFVQSLVQGASVRLAEIESNSMNIVVDTIDDVDWVSCRLNDVVQSEDYERPFTVVLNLLDWLKVIGDSATCECEGFHVAADGSSVSLGNSTIQFNIVQDFVESILSDCIYPQPCDHSVTENQVVLSDSPSDVPSDMPSDRPSSTPTTKPSAAPSSSPSSTPSASPSDLPSVIPSAVPTSFPTASPSATASDVPSWVPSDAPSSMPSDVPSAIPTEVPTSVPSSSPSTFPSSMPSDAPSSMPSDAPSSVPSLAPSDVPTYSPSLLPSDSPSVVPTSLPSDIPSSVPSTTPSSIPSDSPSSAPSDVPSLVPSSSPSSLPTPTPCIESLSLVSTDASVLQDLTTNDVINLSSLGTSSLSILVEPAASADRVHFQWEEDGILMTTVAQDTEAHVMGGLDDQSYVPVDYLTTPGVKAVVIDVFDANSVRLCRKIVPFAVIKYSGDSAFQTICIDEVQPSSEQRLIMVPPLR